MRNSTLTVIGAVAALAFGAGLWVARPPSRPERPSVLLITLDTTRADHLGAWDYPRPTSPELDRLARRSTRFLEAMAPMATTLPSHTSLLTGAWPLEHGVLSNVEHGGRRTRPSDALQPVSEVFRAAGWQTAAFVSATPVKRGTGIERGFDHFDQPSGNVRRGSRTTDAALAWLREHDDEPFFVWVHYFDPHGPFDPPAPYDTLMPEDRALDDWMAERGIGGTTRRVGGAELEPVPAHVGYDGEIRYTDHEIARLLARARRRGGPPPPAGVAPAPHGEGLGQHGFGGHGSVWREQVHVPLLIALPWRTGGDVTAPVSLVDVMPTLVRELGVPGGQAWLETTSGRDLWTDPGGPQLALSSLRQTTFGQPEARAFQAGRWRWVEVDGRTHLFDLRHDPYELHDLSEVLPLHAALLARFTAERVEALRERGIALGAGQTIALPEAELEALRQLGYLDEE